MIEEKPSLFESIAMAIYEEKEQERKLMEEFNGQKRKIEVVTNEYSVSSMNDVEKILDFYLRHNKMFLVFLILDYDDFRIRRTELVYSEKFSKEKSRIFKAIPDDDGMQPRMRLTIITEMF